MSTQTSTHWCGGTLVFTRNEDGTSSERCAECGWFYTFGTGRSAAEVMVEVNRQCRPRAAS